MSNHQKPREERMRLVSAAMGEPRGRYIANKAKGGDNGRKGTRYEDFFAAFALAEVLAEKVTELNPGDWPDIYEQVVAFVDDLVVVTKTATRYHQLKNVQTLTWQNGEHSIETDFSLQKQLSDIEGEPSPHTTLVTSGARLAENLRKNIPETIASHSDVLHFPYANGSINRLVWEHEPLQKALSMLTRANSANGTKDELEYTFGALISSFLHQKENASSLALLECAQKQSPGLLRLFPHQIRDIKFREDFVKVLAQIDGLKYFAETGFFCWFCFSDSGVLPYSCLDPQFAGFQARVAAANPMTFDDFEIQLL